MRSVQWGSYIIAGSLSLIAPCCLAAGDESARTGAAATGVNSGLRRSPDLYLAAVLEVVGEPECSGPESSATCDQKVKLLEVLVRHGTEAKAGDVIVFSNAGTVGSKYLAFLVPIQGRPNAYGATSLSIGATDEARTRFMNELEAAGLKPGA